MPAEPVSVRRVLIADDHPLYREALREVLYRVYPEAEFLEAATRQEVMAYVTSNPAFDLILLDLKLPGASGLSCLKELRLRALSTPIGVVSAVSDPRVIREVMMAGASAYLPKSGSRRQLIDVIHTILGGGTYLPADAMAALCASHGTSGIDNEGPEISALTARQVHVLELLGKGMSNKLIARELDNSEITTKGHVSAILKKLGLTNRVQAAMMVRRVWSEI